MAGNALTDMLGFGAAQALGKASGQDFLGPMMQGVQQKDLIAFQRKQAEEARARERKQEHTERTASRKNFLSALQAAGAVRPEDVIAGGGVDALAEMDDADFTIFQQTLQRNRIAELSDEEQRQMAIVQARLRGIPIPDKVGKNEAISLIAQADYFDLQKKETEAQRQDSYNSMSGSIEANATAIEQMFAQELNITRGKMADAAARVTQLRAQLNNADLDPRRRPELEARLAQLEAGIAQRGSSVVANEIGAMGPSAQFMTYADVAGKDPQAAAMALNRPGMVENVATMKRNYDALRQMPEDVAKANGLAEAKAAADAAASHTELLKNPADAYRVFDAKVETATVRAGDAEKKQAVALQAQGFLSQVSDMASIGGPWALAAEDIGKLTTDDLIIGDAGQYDLNPSPVVNALAARIRQAVDHAFLPGNEDALLDIQSQLEEMEQTPLGEAVLPLVKPFLTAAQREMFDRMAPDSYRLTEKIAAKGIKKMQHGADNVLYRTEASATGEAFNPAALKIIEDGGATVLSADIKASRQHLERSREQHEEARNFALLTGNTTLAKTATAADKELLAAEEQLLFQEQSSGLFMGAMGAIYEAGRSGATKDETVDRVAASLAASMNRLFTEYGMASDVPSEIGDDLRAALGKGDSIAQATLEYVRANRQMFAQAAQTKGKAPLLEQEINYRIQEWEQVMANLPEIEEGKQKSYRKFLSQSGYADASLTGDIAANDYILGLIARRAR